MKKLILPLMLVPALCFGWGPEGHRIIGQIADNYLNAIAKAKINKLMEGQSLSEVSNWLDHMRDTWDDARPFHYISMPVDALKYEPAYCDKGICAMSVIGKYEARLLNSIESPPSKAESIKIIVHLIEDLHMPLHTGGEKGDYGGNAVKVDFFGTSSNLHKVYDTNIIQHANKTDEEWVNQLTKSLTEEQIANVQSGTLEDWVNESHTNVNLIYKNLPKKKDGKVIMDEEYVAFGNKIIEEQLVKAGLRLAQYLNDTMGKVTMN